MIRSRMAPIVILVIVAAATLFAVLATSSGTTPLRAQAPTTISLQPGGNFVPYGGPTLPAVDALNDAAASVPAVFAFNEAAQDWDGWRRGPAFLSDFQNLENGEVYWVVVEGTDPVTWTWQEPVPGFPNSSSVALVSGINIVWYNGATLAAEDALNDALSAVEVVWFSSPA